MLTRDDRLIEIIWSPTREDEFAAYDNDLYLFKISNTNTTNTSNNVIQLCDETKAELVANYGENVNPRIVAWSYSTDNPYLFAVSLPNHKIQLLSFNPSKKKNSHEMNANYEILREFSFRQVRQCKMMAWNPIGHNFLACSFEKIRNEHSILVWDVTNTRTEPFKLNSNESNNEIITHSFVNNKPQQPQYQNKINYLTNIMNNGSSSQANALSNPVETRLKSKHYWDGKSQTCNSLSWNPNSESSLLVGMNSKFLKIYDIKDTTAASLSTNTKFVNSFMMDSAPNGSAFLAASFIDKTVALWDTRRFDKPFDSITESENISKIEWSSTKSGKLAVLAKNSNFLNIYSIRSINSSSTVSVMEDENAPKQIIIDKTSKKSAPLMSSPNQSSNSANASLVNHKTKSNPNITNFCWSSFDSNKIIYSTNFSLSNLRTLCLSDKIILTWSPHDNICWSSNLGKINMIENFDKHELDIISLMKSRNESHYGLKYDIITISNGNATATSSTPLNMYPTSANSSSITLSLTLNSYLSGGINTLIRSDFLHNFKYCTPKNDSAYAEFNQNVKYLWQWFDSINRFFELTIPLNPRNSHIELTTVSRNILTELYWTRYCGLRALLDDFIKKKPETNDLQHNHEERFKTITFNLCGWDMKDGNISRQFFANLENRNQFERAACLAVLTNNFEQALDILESSSKLDNRFGCLWIALKYFHAEQQKMEPNNQQPEFNDLVKQHSSSSISSYSSVKLTSPVYSLSSMSPNNRSAYVSATMSHTQSSKTAESFVNESVLEECNRIIEHFGNPYLKALFNFILNKDEAISKILRDRNLLLQDRIALSIYFMHNRKTQTHLLEYFDYIINDECIRNGDLHGVLLTGLNMKCIELFQNFIAKTNDLQTVALAIIHTPYKHVLESDEVQSWIHDYRELLNTFKMWEKRAEFDVLQMKLNKSKNTLVDLSPTLLPTSPFISSPKHSHTMPNGNGEYLLQYTSKRHSNNQNMNIHMACNRCAKNLMSKQADSRGSIFEGLYVSGRAHANTINNNLGGNMFPNNHLSNNLHNSNSYFQGSSKAFTFNGYKLNESSIKGCFNCAKYLPQCTVCLKFMSINLTPVPTSNAMSQPISVNPTTQYIIPLNRSQSLYAPSKIVLPLSSTNSASKIAYDLKTNALISPPQNLITAGQVNYQNSKPVQYNSGSMYISNSNNSNNNLELEPNEPCEEQKSKEMLREELQSENLQFLEANRFGKWFAWCQTCKHGGHIKHLIDWFKNHEKCPFLHCKCECLNLDDII